MIFTTNQTKIARELEDLDSLLNYLASDVAVVVVVVKFCVFVPSLVKIEFYRFVCDYIYLKY